MAQGVLDRTGEGRILVFGDVMLDRYTWGEVARISPEAPVPVLKVRERSDAAGGAGNVAVNLAGLGCSVTLVGFVGSDHTGERLRQVLGEAGVVHHCSHRLAASRRPPRHGSWPKISNCSASTKKTSPFRRTNTGGKPSTFWMPTCAAMGRLCFPTTEKGHLTISISPGKWSNWGAASDIPVLVDPKGKDWGRYRGATCVTPNTAELEAIAGPIDLSGESGLIEAGNRIRKTLDFEWLLVTRGKKGMCLTGGGVPTADYSRAGTRGLRTSQGRAIRSLPPLPPALPPGLP